MSSAFNTVDSSVILPKLKMMGFEDEALSLVENYMKGRTNRTCVQNHVTKPRHVYTGIGEGSVLGPCTFLICVLDTEVVLQRTRQRVEDMFPELRNNKDDLRLFCVGFADDISGLVDCVDPNVMRATLTIMSEEYRKYFTAQGLKVNPDKEEHITWAKKASERAEVTLMGRDSTPTLKLLGLTVDNTYSFMPHAVSVTRRMMERVSYLYRVRDYVTKKVLIMLLKSLLLSIAEFGLEIHGRALAVKRKIQKAFNIALRAVTHGNRMTSVRRMLMDTGLMNMELTYKYYLIMLVERLIATEGSSLEMEVIRRGQCHQYNTRTKSLLAEWRPFSDIGYNSHLLTALKVYNSLRVNQMRWKDWDELKTNLKERLLTSQDNGNI